jgi:hypothetical protein
MPQIERFRRLNIIVVVDQERPRAVANAAVHHRRRAGHAEYLHLRTKPFEPLRHQHRRLFNANTLSRNRRLTQQRAEFIEIASLVLFDVRIKAVHSTTPLQKNLTKGATILLRSH